MSFKRIAAELNVSEGTVRRAYDKEHEDDIRKVVERGETPSRGRYSHLGEDVYDKILQLLCNGTKPKEVAAKVGCGRSTACYER